ncbi:MAG TPA: enoyl-CoA hydratase-related protein, partial [Alphaproteobacteria bacterium]|nr:enoyl-CoA hydratase-related protein [Alphaproteobacteria bacterium]
ELEDKVRETAAAIAANAPLSVIAAKAMINELIKDPDARDMDKVRAVRKACIESNDFREGRRAFNEKRKPEWTGT